MEDEPSRERRPRCPECGAPSVPIIYGMPTSELMDAADRGAVALGGCVVGEEDWACTGPEQHAWRSLAGDDAEWTAAGEAAFGDGGGAGASG